jgi:hypothetical protein
MPVKPLCLCDIATGREPVCDLLQCTQHVTSVTCNKLPLHVTLSGLWNNVANLNLWSNWNSHQLYLSSVIEIKKNHTFWCGKVTATICVISLVLQKEQSAVWVSVFCGVSYCIVMLNMCVCKSVICFFFRERFQNTVHISVWNNCILTFRHLMSSIVDVPHC